MLRIYSALKRIAIDTGKNFIVVKPIYDYASRSGFRNEKRERLDEKIHFKYMKARALRLSFYNK